MLNIDTTYLKNGRLRSKPEMGADRWISKTNNGQLSKLYFPKRADEQMARGVREWTTVRSCMGLCGSYVQEHPGMICRIDTPHTKLAIVGSRNGWRKASLRKSCELWSRM